MTKLKKYVKSIDEELDDAQKYAECYIENKAKNNMNRANYYKEMSNQELNHANYLHGMAVYDIEELSKVYTPPVDMQEKWDTSHKKYVEKQALIKKMLEM